MHDTQKDITTNILPRPKERVIKKSVLQPVLCVDLDGTVLRTDVLWESILLLMKQQPWCLLALPFWLVRGKAFFKREIATRVILEPASLPFHTEVLTYLKDLKEQGRSIVLVTASDFQPAEAIASHLGLFSEVVASDGVTNLSGQRKCDALVRRYGERNFDYIGNSNADLAVWPSANEAMLVDPSQRLKKKG